MFMINNFGVQMIFYFLHIINWTNILSWFRASLILVSDVYKIYFIYYSFNCCCSFLFLNSSLNIFFCSSSLFCISTFNCCIYSFCWINFCSLSFNFIKRNYGSFIYSISFCSSFWFSSSIAIYIFSFSIFCWINFASSNFLFSKSISNYI
jgi:hypothetical protein